MQQNLISNGKDISRISGLMLKMINVHYFAYIFFYTHPQIAKLVSLEIDSIRFQKQMNHSKERSNDKVIAKTSCSPAWPRKLAGFYPELARNRVGFLNREPSGLLNFSSHQVLFYLKCV